MSNKPDMIQRGEALALTRDPFGAETVTSQAIAAIPTRSYDDVDLLFDAYKAILVLHKSLDTYGLTLGAQVARELADRIVKAHPEFPPRTALRAAVAASQPDPRGQQIARLVEAAERAERDLTDAVKPDIPVVELLRLMSGAVLDLRAALAAVKGGDA